MPQPERTPGFLSTTVGKVVVAGVALLFLLVIAGTIIFMLLAGGGISSLLGRGGVTTTTSTSQSSVTTSVAVDAVPIVNPEQKPLSASFTFRNVFAPSIKPPIVPVVATETATAASTTTTTTSSSPDTSPTVVVTSTLFLVDIITEGDAHKGVFTLNGVSYTAGNGETINSSAWKVIEVGTDSVLMLYGDDQVTIAIGQGVTK